ncbi:hypothetical protein NP493_382g02052 [Ridgeia piscesae]|uniref:Striatin N-terminal domain-containing protein n=1 Tax=Ridgeia piscesae TaxID=27915 RepID=A0AAD9L2C1_RIDPI|nr:hypothetical protein NP493_382g02052 [Ridgeia piscesae]
MNTARVAFLQGERKGQENLKQDLVRRIKMLEFALKQERAKYHKLKYGTELSQGDMKSPTFDKEDKDELLDGEVVNRANSNTTWRQGRQLLRQYLQEIGYTDTIIDVRSSRVRQLLGLQPLGDATDENRPMVNGETGVKRPSEGQGRTPNKKGPTSMAENALMESEASVLATFDFLGNVNTVDDEENLSDGEVEDGTAADDESDERLEKRKAKAVVENESMVEDVMADAETEEALAEFDFLVSESGEGAGEARSQGDGTEWEKKDLSGGVEEWGVDQQLISKLKEQYQRERQIGKKGMQRPKRSTLQAMLANLESEDDLPALQSGAASPPRGGNNNVQELEQTGSPRGSVSLVGVPPDNEDALEAALDWISATKEAFRKTWNAKYTLRRTASLDVEPIYTFRGHTGPILCLAMSATGETCYSGGLDSTIRCWNIPNSNIDPYDSFDPSVQQGVLTAHTDAVWGLCIHSSKSHLLSCSADGTVRLWSPSNKTPLLNTFWIEDEEGVPTSVDFVRCEPSQMVAAYTSCHTHPTLPLTITAHEDRHIRFFDNNTGKMVHSMVAHLEAVTSLAVDPNGLYLLSGSHDCSIRLWNLDGKTCVQEITSHRKKCDEAIHDVAFHPSKPYIASAGADALAKVFV